MLTLPPGTAAQPTTAIVWAQFKIWRRTMPTPCATAPRSRQNALQLVEVVDEEWGLDLEALLCAEVQHDLGCLCKRFLVLVDGQRVRRNRLPVVEAVIDECTTVGLLAEHRGKRRRTDGLRDRDVGLDGQAPAWEVLREHELPAATTKRLHDTSLGLPWRLNEGFEDGLNEAARASHHRREEYASRGWLDLPHAAMDRVRVQLHVEEVEADAAHRLLADRTLLRRPQQTCVHALLDLVKVLDALRLVDEDVGAVGCPQLLRCRTEAPDLHGVNLFPPKLLLQDLTAHLHVLEHGQLVRLDRQVHLLGEGLRLDVQSVVLVRRLRQTDQ